MIVEPTLPEQDDPFGSISVKEAVDITAKENNFHQISTTIQKILAEKNHISKSYLWQVALERAIDIGSLSISKQIDRDYSTCGSPSKDQWCIYRSAQHDHFKLVDYFVEEKKKLGTFESYMYEEIAGYAASNNNKDMMEYALVHIAERYETAEEKRNAIFELLANTLGPVRRAIDQGHLNMVKFLINQLEESLPPRCKGRMSAVANKLDLFYCGKNVSEDKWPEIYAYLNHITSTPNFSSIPSSFAFFPSFDATVSTLQQAYSLLRIRNSRG